jgi:hypothetical protein
VSDDGPAGYNLTDPLDREDRRKHLELVSAIVGRMAGASAAAKGWSITLAGAAFGVALVRDKWYLIVLGIVALVLFSILDGLYLHNEKRFRDLYDAIAIDNAVQPFSMKTDGLDVRPKNKSFVSWSVLGFYAPLIIGGLILLIAALCHDISRDDETPAPSPPTLAVTTPTATATESPKATTPPAAPATTPTSSPSSTPTTLPPASSPVTKP